MENNNTPFSSTPPPLTATRTLQPLNYNVLRYLNKKRGAGRFQSFRLFNGCSGSSTPVERKQHWIRALALLSNRHLHGDAWDREPSFPSWREIGEPGTPPRGRIHPIGRERTNTMVKDPLRTPSASDVELRPTIQIFAPCTNEHVNQDMHHTPNDNTTGINTVFLAVGYENPAFDPHSLIIAGDVEQNPGPIQPAKQPVCHGCESAIIPRLLPLAFTCNQAQCERNCHREEKCSKLIHSKTKTWFCMDHIHLSSATPNITSRGDIQTGRALGGKCDHCGNKIRGDNPLICNAAECHSKCHRWMDCSGIGRYKNLKKIHWYCKSHNKKQPAAGNSTKHMNNTRGHTFLQFKK